MKRLLAYYVSGRVFEWYITLSMISLFIAMMFDRGIIQASAFHWMLMVMSASFIQFFLFVVGFTSLVGLLLNGHQINGITIGPIIRGVCAATRAVMWVQFASALVVLSFKQGFMSPGIPFWTWAVVAELYLTYKVVARNERGN